MRELILPAQATPTITAGAYTSGKALGGLLTFSDIGLAGFGTLLSVAILDKGNQKAAIDLLLFNQSFTATANGSTIAISAGDFANMIGIVSVATADYVTVGNSANAIATKANVILPIIAGADNNIYGQLVCRGTPTYASTSDITVKLCVKHVRD